ncbi:hypothetical protein [Staphylococcus saprophyticus]|uniref:hypothetical protein n=1 Tax=Staphylococcus saprophyticus TaxID=29385 RepID=UPI00384FA80C
MNRLETWKLLQAQDVKADEEVKERWEDKGRISVENTRVAIEYLKTLDMAEILEINSPASFDDLFEEGKKASIFKKENSSVYLYKTKGSKSAMDLVEVIRQLRGLNVSSAISYISEMFEVEYGTKSQRIKDINKSIDDFQYHVLTVELKDVKPETHKLLKDGRTEYGRNISEILTIFKNHIIEVDGEPRMISQLSSRELSIRMYGNEKSYKKVQRVLNMMVLLGLIDKLKNDEVPNEILQGLLNFQNKNQFTKRTDVFEVKQLEFDFFNKIEGKAGVINSKGITSSTLTRDGIIHSLGLDEGNKVFVQDTNKMVSNITKEVEHEAISFIHEKIEANGYVEEQDVIEHLAGIIGKTKAKTKIKEVKTQLTEGYGLERVRLNKALKKSFDVTTNYKETQAPTIYKLAN